MYGKFSDDKREFHIEKVDTPRPWVNYLFNRDGTYVSLLSHNAGGYSFFAAHSSGKKPHGQGDDGIIKKGSYCGKIIERLKEMSERK